MNITLKTNTDIITHLLSLAPAAWEAAIDTMENKPSAIESLRAALDDTAERCAFLAEYIAQRGGRDGTGNKQHEAAAKSARKQMIKVSKALGYTYAERRAFNI